MYVVVDGDNFYILHACKKQKGKAERFELNKAINRAKNLGNEIGKISYEGSVRICHLKK